MTTTATPPAPPRNTSSRVVAVVTIAVGVVVVLGTVFGAVVPTFVASLARDQVARVSAVGVAKLAVTSGASSLAVRFGDVPEAVLDVRSVVGADAWTLRRDGAAIVIENPRSWLVSWFGGGRGGATLTLPRSLESAGIDADLELGAGVLTVQGAFGALDAEVGAGALTIDGSARSLALDLHAGRADIDLRDVGTATLGVSAGQIAGSLTGTPPTSLTLTASAGSIDLGLPDVAYDVRTSVSAGGIDNGLQTSRSAPRTIDVTVSAGSIAVTPLRSAAR